MTRQRLLLVDDEALYARSTSRLLIAAGFDCETADSAPAAINKLRQSAYDLALVDLRMPGNENLELLTYLRQEQPQLPVVVVTGHPSLPSAIESVRLGISDYLLKPVAFDDLLQVIQRVLSEQTTARTPPAADEATIVAESPGMRSVLEIAERVARTDVNILITGESGTGKEVVAREIHRLSQKRDRAFQPIDCAAIPEGLLESTLFGHVRGAFTGAVSNRVGLLTQCHEGTAFLDEIGELPLTLQVKLLRTIQNEAFTPVGDLQEVRINTRFISATSRDLDVEVAEGRFRRDLYYRLAVVHLRLPPLRERPEDLRPLVDRWLHQLHEINPQVTDFSPEAWKCLRQHAWPGNVRELRNVIERGLSLARGPLIGVQDLPPEIARHTSIPNTAVDVVEEPVASSPRPDRQSAERDYFTRLMQEHQGNVTKAAQQAGLSRQGLHRLLKKHGISPQKYRQH